MVAVDLNSDLGESFGQWRLGDDEAMFELVSSANIACGFHAGDPLTMLASCRLAVSTGTVIGAHPSYRDLAGFGRREMSIAADELYGDVLYQLAALAGVASTVGTRVEYVKPHGALYNRIVTDDAQAAAVAAAVANFDPSLPILGMAGSAIEREARSAGLRFVREGFADRAYAENGMLVPRSQPGAVITDPADVAQRAVAMATGGSVDSICLHGDTPGAVGLARAVRAALDEAGVIVGSFV